MINADAVVIGVQELPTRLEEGIRNGLEAIGEEAGEELDRELQKIEDAPIPVSGTGRPLWEHKGQLLEARAEPVVSDDSVIVGFEGEPVAPLDNWVQGWAERREALGTPANMPDNPAGGVIRENRFSTNARAAMDEKAPRIMEREIMEALRD